jgi:hypothetical protein
MHKARKHVKAVMDVMESDTNSQIELKLEPVNRKNLQPDSPCRKEGSSVAQVTPAETIAVNPTATGRQP